MQTEQTNVKEQQAPETAAVAADHGKKLVTVTINGQAKEIPRGIHSGAELKALLGVPESEVLDEVIDGEFKPIGDHERVDIKGCEVFISHRHHGGSS